MSRTHRKYIREQIVKDDKHQQFFSETGSLQERGSSVAYQEIGLNVNQDVLCPYCLAKDKLQRFLVSTKKGISKGKAQCPTCKTGLLMHSVTRTWDAGSYAEWVYDISRFGFWKKIHYDVWKTHLAELGWTEVFWERYKTRKSENPREENYSDYMNRQGEEAAKEWNESGVE